MNENMKHRLLIAEDNVGLRETLVLEFRDLGFLVTEVASFAEFMSLSVGEFEFALIDLKLGADSGLKILSRLSTEAPLCRTVVLTGYGSIATAVKAMRLGAINYLTKPTSTSRILEAFHNSDLSQEPTLVIKERMSLARAEREYIEHIIEQCGGNITKAASVLGLHRQSLQRKIRKFPPR